MPSSTNNIDKGEYHKFLKKVLTEFQKENCKKLNLYKKPIKITSSKRGSKAVIEYNPDFVLKLKTGKKSFEYLIFEFLDTQDDTTTMADIARSVFVENCRMLIFLSKTPTKHKETRRIIDVFIDGFERLIEKEGNKEDILDIVNQHIPSKLGINEVKKLIYNEINKRITLKK